MNGKQQRDYGIQLSLDHAEYRHEGWQEQAYGLLQDFIKGRVSDFLCEDFREYCERHGLTTPPSLRAYGGIILKAARNGLIRNSGYAKVKNEKAHQANAAVWCPIKMQHNLLDKTQQLQ